MLRWMVSRAQKRNRQFAKSICLLSLRNVFLRENIIDRTYKLDDKMAGVFPGTVRYICGPLVSKRRRGRPIYQVPLDEHEQIVASL